MKILITGAHGQLGSELAKFADTIELVLTGTYELDITDKDNVNSMLQENNFTHIINCAAYTAVDLAEDEFVQAEKINVTGVENLAIAAKEQNVSLLHISTDFVFSGQKSTAYQEEDPTSPLGAYGKTKLLGEEKALALGAVVVRTSWLYSVFGNNFVKTMLRLGEEKEELGVVCDQIGCPTNAADLALALITMVKQKPQHNLYHFCNDGVASWYDFAIAIMQIAELNCRVKPISSAEFRTRAKRPSFSVLSNQKVKSEFKLAHIHWRESLSQVIKTIQKKKL